MERLITNMGGLTKLKQLNRDLLAKKVEWDKANMLKAFAGDRPVPSRYMAGLRKALGLDDAYHFIPDEIHALTVTNGEAQADILLDVLHQFFTLPVKNRWVLRGIPESGGEALACVLEDAANALVVVRNDDALLFCPSQWQDAQTKTALSVVEYFDKNKSVEREVPMALFELIFNGDIRVEEVRNMLNREAKVWTWSRIAACFKRKGWDANIAAERLGLD